LRGVESTNQQKIAKRAEERVGVFSDKAMPQKNDDTDCITNHIFMYDPQSYWGMKSTWLFDVA